MIAVTRKQARQLRRVIRQALNITSRGLPLPVLIQTGPEGLTMRARRDNVAVEYHKPGDQAPRQFGIPVELLADCEGSKDEPVEIEPQGDRHVVARWCDAGVPITRQYEQADVSGLAEKFPRTSDRALQNSPDLIRALYDATETASDDSVRYAIDFVQLRGKSGTVAATDGRHLLVQTGFSFPWDDDVLIPRIKVFGSSALPNDGAVTIGRTDHFVSIGAGPWTFHFGIHIDGRFPQVEDHIARPENSATRVHLADADAQFLAKAIRKLPSDDEYNLPVTLDVNGQVVVRAQAEGGSQVTDVVLASSTWDGDPVRINTNRRYLERAARLGFRDICVFGNGSPMLCQDKDRSYVWAVLDPASAIKPSDHAIRIESPSGDSTNQVTSSKSRRQTTMPATKPSTNGHAKQNGSSDSTGESIDALIEKGETLKTSLRETLSKTTELVAALKHHKKQTKQLRSTLLSLRQLQSIDA